MTFILNALAGAAVLVVAMLFVATIVAIAND
jgi:hypothetical protein